MKIPAGRTLSPWPQNKQGVIELAERWYDPELVAVDPAAIAALELPPIKPGADPTMEAGKLGDIRKDIALSVALNSINYQFWDLRDSGFVRYEFEGTKGAMGMRKAFERAWADPESPLSRAKQGIAMSESDVRAMFGDIPNVESRMHILNQVLAPPHFEELVNELASAVPRGIDTALARRLAETCPLAYGDELLKKAQLALSEVWVKAQESVPHLSCDLTAFADYQIPNVLRAMGVLRYDPNLAARIDAMTPVTSGSPEEKALRAASILAVEKIAERAGVPVAEIDHYLWMRRNEAKTPFHLTATTDY